MTDKLAKRGMTNKKRDALCGYLFFLPWIVGFLVFTLSSSRDAYADLRSASFKGGAFFGASASDPASRYRKARRNIA